MSKWDEQILVVNRSTLFNNETLNFHGFLDAKDERVKQIINNFSHYEVKRRGDMEEDSQFKQLISYVIVKDRANHILVYTRLSGGGEQRLHGKSSIGVGGHMNEVTSEMSIEQQLKENAIRELVEEIGINQEQSEEQLTFIGLINDDSNEVGRVHLGIVYQYIVDDKTIIFEKEDDTLQIVWMPSEQFKDIENCETWSALLKPVL